MKKLYKIPAVLLISLCLLFSLFGCGPEGAHTVVTPETESSEAMKMYREAVDAGYTGTYLEFLDEYATWLEDGSEDPDTPPSSSETPDPSGTPSTPDTPTSSDQTSVHTPSEAALSVVTVTSQFRVVNMGMAQETASYGAGVIYELDKDAGDAYILTNYHVIYAYASMGNEKIPHVSDNISVHLYGSETDEGKMSATFVGGSIECDVAVLRIEGDDLVTVGRSAHTNKSVLQASAARAVRIGDSEALAVGDEVYAIGNPNAEGVSVVQGVVSVKAEYIDISSIKAPSAIMRMLTIRVDAAINHGTSGGGLFNAAGEYVGTTNARSEESGIVLFGYAVPSALTVAIAENAIATSEADATAYGVRRASLGFRTSTHFSHSVFDEETGKSQIEEQITVESVSGAAQGKLEYGDVFVSATVNGKTRVLTREYQLVFLSYELRAGDVVTYEILRGASKISVDVEYAAGCFTVEK